MAQESFIKKLLDRRVPHILGSYLAAATSLVLFVEYLVDKYQFPVHYPTLALFGIVGILPTVIILAYFHGALGKDAWTKVEKIGVPINVVFITLCLLFGDYFSLWDISSSQKRHVIYIGSPDINNLGQVKEVINRLSGITDAKEKMGNYKITSLTQEELEEVSFGVESNLLNKFYNQNIEIEILSKAKNHLYINEFIKNQKK